MTSNQSPKGWEVKKLREVCEFFNDGNWIESKDQSEDGYRLIQTGNIGFGEFRNKSGKERYVSEETFNRLKCTEIFEGDILVSRLPDPVGRSCVIPSMDQKMITAVDCTIIRLKNRIITSDFFKYYSQSDLYFKNVREKITGTTRDRISRSNLGIIPIPLPPLSEQNRIVSILDNAFESVSIAKNNAEKNLKNARELFDSYLQSVFANPGKDWEEKKLGEVCKITDGTHFSPKSTNEGEYMYVTAKNIKPYYIDLSKITYLTEKDHREIYKRCPVKRGDVLYIKDGATAGIATINTIEEEFSLLSSVALFKPTASVLNIFLVHYMNSEMGKKNFLGYIDGAAITRLTLIKLKNVVIPLPPLSEQQSIVEKLDALSAETKKLEAIYQKKLDDLDELKKSILDKAFRGEL